MNKQQTIALWAGVAIIVLMVMFPPWCKVLNAKGAYSEIPVGYAPIFLPPTERDNVYFGYYVDHSRLVLQGLAVSMIAGAVIFSLRTKAAAD